jgi:hypothetical protein
MILSRLKFRALALFSNGGERILNGTDLTIGMNDAERSLFRLRALHRERVEVIHKNEGHVRLSDLTHLIVHLLPEAAVREPKAFSAGDLKRAAKSIRLLGERNGYRQSRFNVDGFLLFDGDELVRSYTQLYRNGNYEGVMAEAVYDNQRGAKILRENWCEEAILGAMGGYLVFANTLGPAPPCWMFAALAGARAQEYGSTDHGATFSACYRPEHCLVA